MNKFTISYAQKLRTHHGSRHSRCDDPFRGTRPAPLLLVALNFYIEAGRFWYCSWMTASRSSAFSAVTARQIPFSTGSAGWRVYRLKGDPSRYPWERQGNAGISVATAAGDCPCGWRLAGNGNPA